MLLLDTHTLLWFLFDDGNLPENLKNKIMESDEVYSSIVSFWEIAIKKSLGKLDLDYSIEEIMDASEKSGIVTLPLRVKHFSELIKLEFIHRDPFDRIIISQTISEGMTLISKDEKIYKYDIDVLWS